jgi:hypothetical protein
MASLLDNLSIAWSGDFDSLKKFTGDELNLNGNWEHPGGEKKIFNNNNNRFIQKHLLQQMLNYKFIHKLSRITISLKICQVTYFTC